MWRSMSQNRRAEVNQHVSNQRQIWLRHPNLAPGTRQTMISTVNQGVMTWHDKHMADFAQEAVGVP